MPTPYYAVSEALFRAARSAVSWPRRPRLIRTIGSYPGLVTTSSNPAKHIQEPRVGFVP